MRLKNPRDLGLYVRSERRRLGQTQTELATAARVSRRWLSDLEAGKPTAEVGLVFRTLSALGLILHADRPEPEPGGFDPDEYLKRFVSPNPLLGPPGGAK